VIVPFLFGAQRFDSLLGKEKERKGMITPCTGLGRAKIGHTAGTIFSGTGSGSNGN